MGEVEECLLSRILDALGAHEIVVRHPCHTSRMARAPADQGALLERHDLRAACSRRDAPDQPGPGADQNDVGFEIPGGLARRAGLPLRHSRSPRRSRPRPRRWSAPCRKSRRLSARSPASATPAAPRCCASTSLGSNRHIVSPGSFEEPYDRRERQLRDCRVQSPGSHVAGMGPSETRCARAWTTSVLFSTVRE